MSAVVQDLVHPSSARALLAGDPARLLAFGEGVAIDLATFERQVRALAALLPDGDCAINLCEDRYRFMVAFCAATVRGQATLLPPSRAAGVIAEALRRHPRSHCIGDGAQAAGLPRYWPMPARLPEADGAPLQLQPDAIAAIGFTSGSTGTPSANPKTWASFRTSTAQNLAALRDFWPDGECAHVVATVPPQHMYGMEMSVLLPLLGEAAVHTGRPFFAEDIVRALREAPGNRLLVTTPVHLRALVEACAADPRLAPPPLAGIVSATAPMPSELAAAAEDRFGCELRELFGSTETCVIARRRSAREEAWTPYPGVRIQPQPDGSVVRAAHLAGPVALADVVELLDDGRFLLRGRNADLLEIAGKRASLGDLTRKLQAIPGVEDGVVFQLERTGPGGVRRIAALAVAPSLEPGDILSALRESIDPVFLPRPLRRVPGLPRDPTGKLPRAALLALIGGTSH